MFRTFGRDKFWCIAVGKLCYDQNVPVFSVVLLGFFDLAAALLSLDFPLFISDPTPFLYRTGDFFDLILCDGYLMVGD